MDTVGSIDEVSEAYIIYAKAANQRVLPYIQDGLIPVRRRVLLALNDLPEGKIKTPRLIGHTLNWHPHGTASPHFLVHEGFASSKSQMGSLRGFSNIEAAADRYTDLSKNKKSMDMLFKYNRFSEFIEGELEGVLEPKGLIVPLPIALIYGKTDVIGVGCTTEIPAFDPSSILEAHRHDNPNKLKGAYSLDIVKEESDLKGLWEDGVGKISYRFKISDAPNNSVRAYGDGSMFKPSYGEPGSAKAKRSTLSKWEADGWITVSNEETDFMDLVFTTTKTSRLSLARLKSQVIKEFTISKKFTMNIMDEDYSKRTIGIKEWVSYTLSSFEEGHRKWQIYEEGRFRDKIVELAVLNHVADLVQKDKSIEDILKYVKLPKTIKSMNSRFGIDLVKSEITIDRVKGAAGRPISFLRKSDLEGMVRGLLDSIDEVRSKSSKSIIVEGAKFISNNMKI